MSFLTIYVYLSPGIGDWTLSSLARCMDFT